MAALASDLNWRENDCDLSLERLLAWWRDDLEEEEYENAQFDIASSDSMLYPADQALQHIPGVDASEVPARRAEFRQALEAEAATIEQGLMDTRVPDFRTLLEHSHGKLVQTPGGEGDCRGAGRRGALTDGQHGIALISISAVVN